MGDLPRTDLIFCQQRGRQQAGACGGNAAGGLVEGRSRQSDGHVPHVPHAFENRMLQQGHGNIVNVASMSGLVVNPLPQQQCAYTIQGGRHHADEVHGQRVGAARRARQRDLPRLFTGHAALTARRIEYAGTTPAVAKWLGGTPIGRVAQPDEMVGLVLYLQATRPRSRPARSSR